MLIETKTYSDGTTATGVAPLPDQSPREQEFLTMLESILDSLRRGRVALEWSGQLDQAAKVAKSMDQVRDAITAMKRESSHAAALTDERDQLRAQVERLQGGMSEIDLSDDDSLRFIQRVLESDAPAADRKTARDMVSQIRTRVRKTAERLQGGEPVPSMHRILMQGAADMIKLLCSLKHSEMDLAGTDMGAMIDNLNAAASGQAFTFGEPSPAWVKAMTADAQPAAPALVAWQDIETAPKDGTQILAYIHFDDGEIGIMKWMDFGHGLAAWVWADKLLGDVDPDPYQPTHWMPLPPAPVGIGQPADGEG